MLTYFIHNAFNIVPVKDLYLFIIKKIIIINIFYHSPSIWQHDYIIAFHDTTYQVRTRINCFCQSRHTPSHTLTLLFKLYSVRTYIKNQDTSWAKPPTSAG